MDLVKGRITIPEARYFITICATRPTQNLIHPDVSTAIAQTIHLMSIQQDAHFLCATVMPDHVHFLIMLGGRLSVGRLVAKFKSQTRQTLLQHATGWQRNFFEHRLRPDEATEAFARYIFLNPYRDGLIERKTDWPFWLMGTTPGFDFCQWLETGKYPPIEWISTDLQKLGLSDGSVGVD